MQSGRVAFTDEQHVFQLLIPRTNHSSYILLTLLSLVKSFGSRGLSHFYQPVAIGFYCPGDTSTRVCSSDNSITHTGSSPRAGALPGGPLMTSLQNQEVSFLQWLSEFSLFHEYAI